MNVIIIDDEEHARENLRKKLLKIDIEINIIDLASSASEGYTSIIEHNPDLIFVDIEMPGGDGFSMLEQFEDPDFDVIFVTAYSDYALKAFEMLAIGYITKPVDNELLSKVYFKVKESKSKSINGDLLDELKNKITLLSKSGKVALPTERGVDFIPSESIVTLQSSEGYTNIYLNDKSKRISSKRLKYFEERLDSHFIRMHRSTIINTDFIQKYYKAGFVRLLDGQELPVGRKYKKEVEEKILSR